MIDSVLFFILVITKVNMSYVSVKSLVRTQHVTIVTLHGEMAEFMGSAPLFIDINVVKHHGKMNVSILFLIQHYVLRGN